MKSHVIILCVCVCVCVCVCFCVCVCVCVCVVETSREGTFVCSEGLKMLGLDINGSDGTRGIKF